jgi:hypothetical protein
MREETTGFSELLSLERNRVQSLIGQLQVNNLS